MKYYCSKCFAKIEYKFNKPEKCPFCGFLHSSAKTSDTVNSLSVEPKPSNLEAAKNTNKKPIFDDVEDYEDEYFEVSAVPVIQPGAGVKVEIEKAKNGITIGELMESSSSAKNTNSNSCFSELDCLDSKITQKEMLDQFKREASNREGFIEIV